MNPQCFYPCIENSQMLHLLEQTLHTGLYFCGLAFIRTDLKADRSPEKAIVRSALLTEMVTSQVFCGALALIKPEKPALNACVDSL